LAAEQAVEDAEHAVDDLIEDVEDSKELMNEAKERAAVIVTKRIAEYERKSQQEVEQSVEDNYKKFTSALAKALRENAQQLKDEQERKIAEAKAEYSRKLKETNCKIEEEHGNDLADAEDQLRDRSGAQLEKVKKEIQEAEAPKKRIEVFDEASERLRKEKTKLAAAQQRLSSLGGKSSKGQRTARR